MLSSQYYTNGSVSRISSTVEDCTSSGSNSPKIKQPLLSEEGAEHYDHHDFMEDIDSVRNASSSSQ